jgi:hypothetical protein
MLEGDPVKELPPLSPELRHLIDQVAAYPHGLAFLHLASLESVAVTLRVDARVADQARTMLDTPEGRALLITQVREARRREQKAAPGVATSQSPVPSPGAVPVSTSSKVPAAQQVTFPAASVEELIRRIEAHPLGLRFLVEAPLESVAITFRSHAFLVWQARELVEQRLGLEPWVDESDE